MINVKITRITSPEDMEKCFEIRKTVFVHEQHVSLSEEMDGLDKEAEHYLLSVDGKSTATARIRYLSDVAKIERVAVLKNMRGYALGQRLMDFIIRDIKKNPAIKNLKLGAQIQVVTFYEKLGFESYGDEFLDAGIKHLWMQLKI
ncbi:MAG: GNAT family N-acetyltransferase [Emcibacter sp.]|nr:GNAT family N-acetyltransferase [Emcibacter sp.]